MSGPALAPRTSPRCAPPGSGESASARPSPRPPTPWPARPPPRPSPPAPTTRSPAPTPSATSTTPSPGDGPPLLPEAGRARPPRGGREGDRGDTAPGALLHRELT